VVHNPMGTTSANHADLLLTCLLISFVFAGRRPFILELRRALIFQNTRRATLCKIIV
jgi:hypothetical protein